VRLDLGPSLRADLAAFLVDWDNIIAQGVAGGPQINGGESRHRGVEGLVDADLGHAAGLGFAIPFRLAAAWVEATYGSDVYSGSTLVARSGNQREFSPELTASASLGVEGVGPQRGLGALVTVTWIGEQFSDGLNTVAVPASGSTGLIDEVALLDLTLRWKPEGAAYELYATGRNLADTAYVSYRRGGHGSVAGAPLTAMVGGALRF
jgi:Fe(3+) dicitrate transport protein